MSQSACAKARISDKLHEKGLLATNTGKALGDSWQFEQWSFDETQLKQEGRFESVLLVGTAFNGITVYDLPLPLCVQQEFLRLLLLELNSQL